MEEIFQEKENLSHQLVQARNELNNIRYLITNRYVKNTLCTFLILSAIITGFLSLNLFIAILPVDNHYICKN